jgi:nicotinamidase-related amidase
MGRILVRGEPGHDIIPALYPVAGEPVIDKPGKGAFYQTDLELMLKGRNIDTLLVCGVTTEVCVNTTVREANDRGIRCVVLSDCCASYFPDFHTAGLAMIKAQGGIFGSVTSSKNVLAGLGTP